MSNIYSLYTTKEIQNLIKNNFQKARKEQKVTQTELALKSDVSLGSIKRFETTGEISLNSLIKIAFVLGLEKDLISLFQKKEYKSIEEVIHDSY